MKPQAFKFLSGIDLFKCLPEEEIATVAQAVSEKKYEEGTVLALQGKTYLDHIAVIKKGALGVYHEENGVTRFSGYIKKNEVFGGITILLNASLSLRSIRADEETECYLLPKQAFLDLCTRHKRFHQNFLDTFGKHLVDKSLSSVIAAGQTLHFFANLEPFSFLPEEVLEELAQQMSLVRYPKGTLLFVQGQTRVGYLYVLYKGSAERYYEENNRQSLKGIMAEGDIYGGISILLNDGISVRSLHVIEEAYFYLLPVRKFLEICTKFEAFSEFFTDTFGKRMLDRSYASIIAKTLQPKQQAEPEFFNQPLNNIYRPAPVACAMDATIQQAAAVMAEHDSSFILLKDAQGAFSGMVTATDLTKRVLAKGYDPQMTVSKIMSAPLLTISDQALVFEVLMTMMQKGVKHLAVTDTRNRVTGVVTSQDLVTAQGQSPFFLIREISEADSLPEIIVKRGQLPKMVQNLINSGAKAKNVTRFITTIADTVLHKLMEMAFEQLGPPPCRYVFMILGSEGRREQTLKTDQDNAIVFEDVDEDRRDSARRYFLKLGETVCRWLDQAGYAFCKGEVMAQNPQWCQPLAVWKTYFSDWIHTAEAEDLLRASIFFDFACGYGDEALIEALRRHLFGSLGGWSGFFRHLTENALHFKPPLGFFRNFLVESKGEHRDMFDIKGALMPIIDFARIYALKHKIEDTNTLERLYQLYLKKVITWDEYNEFEKSYGFLMQLRFVRQVSAVIDDKATPDNYINPKKLARIEQTTLKEIFKRIEKFQSKLSFEFIGM